MDYVLFLDDDQKEFLENLNKGEAVSIKDCLDRLKKDRNGLYFTELNQTEFYKLVLEIKRLDKSTTLTSRLFEIGQLQNIGFRLELEKFRIESQRYNL